MIRTSIFASAIVAMAALPAAAGEEFADLTGTWVGDSEAILAGDTNNYDPASGQAFETISTTFTLRIDFQDGRRFAGTNSSPLSTESIVGVISDDGTIFWVDEDGYLEGYLKDENTIHACYLLVEPGIQLASCLDYVRQ